MIELMTGFWSDLRPHAERESLFIVSLELELAEVAKRVAADDSAAVNQWVESGRISRPSPDQMRGWESAKAFSFVILQPYVFVQEQAH